MIIQLVLRWVEITDFTPTRSLGRVGLALFFSVRVGLTLKISGSVLILSVAFRLIWHFERKSWMFSNEKTKQKNYLYINELMCSFLYKKGEIREIIVKYFSIVFCYFGSGLVGFEYFVLKWLWFASGFRFTFLLLFAPGQVQHYPTTNWTLM